MGPNDNITSVKGIGDKTAVYFQRAGIYTVQDLISYYPRGYEECSAPQAIQTLETSGTVVISGTLIQEARVRGAGRYRIVESVVRDETGSLKVTWFNMPYLKNALQPGRRYIMKGKLTIGRYGKTLEQPVIYTPENYAAMMGRLKPVYSLTTGLKSGMLTKAIQEALDALPELREYLPSEIRKEWKLAEYNYAIRTIHFPKDRTELMFARHRLVFDEFFLFILAVRYLRDHNEETKNGCPITPSPEVDTFIQSLPYDLTGAQRRCYEEILQDLSGEKVMNRLVQGDVGSGKTVVALLALLQMVYAGYQGVLMAPTEVLARQHQETITGYLERAGRSVRVELLTGSMTAKEKRMAYERIAAGEADIIIGTHAVIQDKVHFHKLGLVITDEQHRFGVRQRETLIAKGEENCQVPPHVLVMSATPIPRTLAIILYGDLDISVIDEKPANRLPIKNCVIGANRRKKAYEFIINQVKEGHQAYVICPLVEESQQMDGENVKDYADKLRTELPPAITVGILHGRMKASEKNQVMEDFSAGRIQVLVSTTVVEVGVDVPNATVMVIENAERFGLAQLHQLRGRIGRGKDQSYCIFINGSDASKVKRLEILNRSNDGFEIASEDLKLRGPGDIFGIRQSGIMEFTLGDIYTDAGILKEASQAADKLLREDYGLDQPSHKGLRQRLEVYMDAQIEKISL
jgi:ATP-dependent DNA helicase RecG